MPTKGRAIVELNGMNIFLFLNLLVSNFLIMKYFIFMSLYGLLDVNTNWEKGKSSFKNNSEGGGWRGFGFSVLKGAALKNSCDIDLVD